MDIVIISEFCEDFSETDNDRFLYLAKMLSQEHDVEIITSTFRHTTKSQRKKPANDWPFRITFIEEPGYPRNVCVKRFQSHYIWGKNLLKYIENRTSRPDVIYCAVPSLTGPNLVAKYCEKKGIRFVIDVQDLWPEAFQMVVNIPIISDIGFLPFTLLANGIYKRADAICAVSDTYCRRAARVNKKVQDTTTVFLGTEIATFDKYAAEKPILEKNTEEIWLGYAGTLGTSYNLPVVFDALRKLQNPSLHFIIMGDGPLKDEFEKEARGLKVTFVGRLPYEQMCAILSACDIVVNPIVGSSVATIINKHADYAASGKPVINTQRSEEYQKLVDKYQMGLNCNDFHDVLRALKDLLDSKKMREQMGKAARKCAEECFDRGRTYEQLVGKIIENRGKK